MAKLTEAQRRVLARTERQGGVSKGELVQPDWRRLDRLTALGLCEVKGIYGRFFYITTAGREALKAEDGR